MVDAHIVHGATAGIALLNKIGRAVPIHIRATAAAEAVALDEVDLAEQALLDEPHRGLRLFREEGRELDRELLADLLRGVEHLPRVGVGARHGLFAIDVLAGLERRDGDGRVEVVVQADDYRRTDKNGISEMQTYEYTPNPDACKITVTKRKDGFWRKVGDSNGGGRFSFKARNAYQDPSF